MATKAKFRDRRASRSNQGKKKKEDDDKNSFKVYSVLPLEDTNELIGASLENVEKKLITFLHLDDPTVNLKDGITLDYYVEGVLWAKEQEFNPPKFSGFFTVLQELYNNVKEKHFSIEKNIKHFRRYYGGIGLAELQDSSHSDLFNIKEAKKIITYFCTTIFQHYALYEYFFTHTQAEELIGTQLKIETTNSIDGFFAPPLTEAVPELVWEKYRNVLPNSEEDRKASTCIDPLTPCKEDLELLSELHEDEIEQTFELVLSELLPHIQPEILPPLQERQPEILLRIKQLAGLEISISSSI